MDPYKTLVCAEKLDLCKKVGSLLHHIENVFFREQNSAVTQCSILISVECCYVAELENSEKENASIKRMSRYHWVSVYSGPSISHLILGMVFFLE